MAKAKVVGGLDDALTKAGKNVMKAINGEVIQHSNEKIVSKMAYGALNNGFGAATPAFRRCRRLGESCN